VVGASDARPHVVFAELQGDGGHGVDQVRRHIVSGTHLVNTMTFVWKNKISEDDNGATVDTYYGFKTCIHTHTSNV